MEYYLYRHIREDKDEVFYIGIGRAICKYTSTLSRYRRAYAKKNRNTFWQNIVNKTSYKVEILFESNTREEIEEKEKEFIKLYGRRDLGLGTLVNLTDGGDKSHNLSTHSREKMREIRKANPISPEQYKKMAASRRANKKECTQEYRDWMRKFNLENRVYDGTHIFQYSLEGDFIKEWRSYSQAAKVLNITKSNLGIALKQGRVAKDFQWFYEYKGEKISSTKSVTQAKKVKVSTLDGELLGVFDNVIIAVKELGVPSTSLSMIYNSLKIKTRTAYKLKWEYYDL